MGLNESETSINSVSIRSLGQSGVLISVGNYSLVIDPYLSNVLEEEKHNSLYKWTRNFPPPDVREALKDVVAVLVTHTHRDHCDKPTLLRLLKDNSAVCFYGPYPVIRLLKGWGVPKTQIVQLSVDQRISLGKAREVTAIPAAHYDFEPNSEGQPSYFGYILKVNGLTFYHAGDTIIYEGMVERLRQYKIDIAFLPVNGRDKKREDLGITGNMNADEAVGLANEIKIRMLMPIHNDMFEINSVPQEKLLESLERCCDDVSWKILKPGEKLFFK